MQGNEGGIGDELSPMKLFTREGETEEAEVCAGVRSAGDPATAAPPTPGGAPAATPGGASAATPGGSSIMGRTPGDPDPPPRSAKLPRVHGEEGERSSEEEEDDEENEDPGSLSAGTPTTSRNTYKTWKARTFISYQS